MPSELAPPPGATRTAGGRGFFRGLLGGRPAGRTPAAPDASPDAAPRSKGLREMVRRLVAEDRYAFALLKEAAEEIGEADARLAWEALEAQMAIVPAGEAPIVGADGQVALLDVPAFYLDRFAVTNRQYQRFVQAGGYDDLKLWPQASWSSLVKFVDKTGQPGPRGWEHGRHRHGEADLPVVGICWHEASAYARWTGKRLPQAAEWQKAGSWPEPLSGAVGNRYPWGDVFDPSRANLFASGHGRPLPVRSCPAGTTPNGIWQLSGNVWEWLVDPLETIPCAPEETFQPWQPLRRIAGGAYDTYLASEATCQFVTGQPELDRRHNIGFRCALSCDRLRGRPD